MFIKLKQDWKGDKSQWLNNSKPERTKYNADLIKIKVSKNFHVIVIAVKRKYYLQYFFY